MLSARAPRRPERDTLCGGPDEKRRGCRYTSVWCTPKIRYRTVREDPCEGGRVQWDPGQKENVVAEEIEATIWARMDGSLKTRPKGASGVMNA